MTITTTPWDVAKHLNSEEAIAAYLDAMQEDGTPEMIEASIRDVARARARHGLAVPT